MFYNDYEDIILTSAACPLSPCLQPNNIGAAEVSAEDTWTTALEVTNLTNEYFRVQPFRSAPELVHRERQPWGAAHVGTHGEAELLIEGLDPHFELKTVYFA